ncbi:alpha/beta fold hydrolase [Rhodococcus sp. NPDC127528]|uniref:alpha/beta fold hydrolase n=1 Tax=unclassified Rhodococcus (in: high G+C Gram-positive bacteria) TaxID=192944 RepID=UPI003638B69A
MQAVSSFVTSDGVALTVREAGPRSAPVTVVFAHGWTLDGGSWDDLIALLTRSARPARLVAIDCRGHGTSGAARAGAATIARYADDLAETVGRLVPDGPIVLVGHSMGAMAMMALAERHPDLVRGRVAAAAFLATAAGRLDKSVERVPGLRAALPVLVGLGFRVHRHLPAPMRYRSVEWLLFGSGARPAAVERTAGEMRRADPRTVPRFGADILRHDRAAYLDRFAAAEVLVAAGSRDRLCPPSHARKIVSRLPEAALVVYEGAGHQLSYERSEDLGRRLAGLLERVESDRTA